MKCGLVAVIALLCGTGFAQVSNNWKLVWADEFEEDGRPNPANWTYEEGFVRNKELQWYQPDNAFCEDGKLIIEGRRKRKPNPNYQPDTDNWRTKRKFANYTASSLKTEGLHAWQYGRFEIRAKISAKNGLWPAIWFLGVAGPWPANGEIDLMEFYDHSILANACWEGGAKVWWPVWDSSKTPVEELGASDWDQEFHLWRMDWGDESIKLYLDDRLLNTVELNKTINRAGRGPVNPFKQPHYLLLNLAIGGKNGGDPSETSFPSRYEIDYVRVYQKP